MYAVVVQTSVTEEARSDPDFTILRQQVIPAVKQAPGFLNGYWLAAVGDIALAVVVFESEDAARAAAAAMGVQPGASMLPGTEILSVEFVEVRGAA